MFKDNEISSFVENSFKLFIGLLYDWYEFILGFVDEIVIDDMECDEFFIIVLLVFKYVFGFVENRFVF